MGRKESWLSSVKKALSANSRKKKAQKGSKSKKKWFGKEKPSVSDFPILEATQVHHPSLEDVKVAEVENEQTEHAYSVEVATATAAEAAVAAAQAAAKVVRLTTATQFTGKSEEDVAAIRIQTAFRGYQARGALRALRGLVRLKSLVDGPTVKRQTTNTLKCMQTVSRVQSQIQSRRIKMSEENRALQRQLLQKHAKEIESFRMGEEWDDSLQSKEKIEANLLHKYEATMRRERALAYSYTHQQTWKKMSRSANLLFMDPANPHWGWSWLERWMASRSCEAQSTADKELNSDCFSIKSAIPSIAGGEITKSFVRHQLNSDNTSSPVNQKPARPASHLSPTTPRSKTASSVANRALKQASPKGIGTSQDNDTRSMLSLQSERNRRHSIAGSSIRDDESLASSPSVPSYMAPTRSAKAKLRLSSPLVVENGQVENTPAGSVKKRISFPISPTRPRRHSGPPKIESSSSIADNDQVNGVIK
ncbi:unnamed protein product [Fraxinus pennsylvanica]|uniref:DUF4005 domain-containing protein n=1 Tax=Fraxinus pennsylvanica TaxID=56036 RepID=A0AAD2A0C7_9LAMI|nr:unnamed protein product [Fraxinus pennsylvanica]